MTPTPTVLSMTYLRCILIGLSFSCLILNGQNISSEEEPPLQANLTGISLDRKISDLYLWTGQEYKQVNFYPGVRSGRIRYAGPKLIQLYEKGENAEGETTWNSVARTELKGGASDFLLFFSKESGASEVQMFAMPEDFSEFNIGSYRFVNLTERRLALKLGEERALLSPMNFADLSANFEHGTSYRSLLVELPQGEGDPELIYSSALYYNKNIRMLYLISSVDGSSSVRLTGIPQKR